MSRDYGKGIQTDTFCGPDYTTRHTWTEWEIGLDLHAKFNLQNYPGPNHRKRCTSCGAKRYKYPYRL